MDWTVRALGALALLMLALLVFMFAGADDEASAPVERALAVLLAVTSLVLIVHALGDARERF